MLEKTTKPTAEGKAAELSRKIAAAEKCLPTAGRVEEHAVVRAPSHSSPGRSPQFGK
jgi:hypothetical protein